MVTILATQSSVPKTDIDFGCAPRWNLKEHLKKREEENKIVRLPPLGLWPQKGNARATGQKILDGRRVLKFVAHPNERVSDKF